MDFKDTNKIVYLNMWLLFKIKEEYLPEFRKSAFYRGDNALYCEKSDSGIVSFYYSYQGEQTHRWHNNELKLSCAYIDIISSFPV